MKPQAPINFTLFLICCWDPQDKFRSNKNMSMLVRCVTNSHLIINVLNSSMSILTNQPPDFSNMLVVMNLQALLPK